MTVHNILLKYERPSTLLGGEPVKTSLLKDLQRQKKLCNLTYAVLFAVVVLLTLVAVVAVCADLFSAQKSHSSVLSAAGIPIPFLLIWMRRLVREWSQAHLLITLIGHSDERSIQLLIRKLMDGPGAGSGDPSEHEERNPATASNL